MNEIGNQFEASVEPDDLGDLVDLNMQGALDLDARVPHAAWVVALLDKRVAWVVVLDKRVAWVAVLDKRFAWVVVVLGKRVAWVVVLDKRVAWAVLDIPVASPAVDDIVPVAFAVPVDLVLAVLVLFFALVVLVVALQILEI